MPEFSRKLVLWQRRHGRHGLPWQGTRDPYRIWLSEVMLQQTQVAAVIPYYERFLARFPTVEALAAASEDEVLRLWAGLGYYARGRNLRNAAQHVVGRGGFPDTPEGLAELPGIGPSTAAAIAAFCFGRSAAILDGNVKRVLARCFGVEGEKAQWQLANELLPRADVETYTQALMDLGATLCTRARPRCGDCPVAKDCYALREDRVAELPAPRKRKPLPLKHATWLVLLHKGQVLLERRPGIGIWGGLWTFPEGEEKGASAYCARKFACEVERTQRLPLIEHGFTHFRLNIRPLQCNVRKKLQRAESPGLVWLDIEEAAQAAVPTPVRALLKSLQ